jgi:hypothetical protein
LDRPSREEKILKLKYIDQVIAIIVNPPQDGVNLRIDRDIAILKKVSLESVS